MYNLTLRGIAGPEPDIVAVRVYVAGGPAIESAATPNTTFTAAATYPSSGAIEVAHSFVDASGNESARRTQSVFIPDVEAPAAPTEDLTLVSVVWA